MYICAYIQKEFVQNKSPRGIWISWDRYAQKPTGSLEQCAQKQIKPLRGPAGKALYFLT